MRNAIVIAVAVAAGVISTPAVSRPKVRTDNNIICPATPPTSDRTGSKERGGGLTIAGFGATATHGKVTSETDVVIRQEGTAGYNDLFLAGAACVAIVNKFPGQPQLQFEALEKELARLERRRAEKAESATSTAAADIVLRDLFANAGCPGGVCQAQPASSTPIQDKPVSDGRSALPAPTEIRNRAPQPTAPAPTQPCFGNACPRHSQSSSSSEQPDGSTQLIDYSAKQRCNNMITLGGVYSPDCSRSETRTCTTSPPMMLPGVVIQTGSMPIMTSPIMIGGGQQSCTTTFHN